jgi:hypothetical protein
MSKIVVLTEEEVLMATKVGEERNRINREAHRTSTIVFGKGLEMDRIGARAEYAISKCFNLKWTGKLFTNAEWKAWESTGGRDVGCVEVRSSKYTHAHMPLFEKDKNNYIYVLVTVQDDYHYTVVGWCFGAEGKKREFWADPAHSGKPYFCYPQRLLRSVESLEKIIDEIGGEFKNDKNIVK